MARMCDPHYKQCVNCVWWAGPRAFDSFRGWAEIDDSHAKGKSMNMKGLYNLETNWMSTCHAFEYHPIIKH